MAATQTRKTANGTPIGDRDAYLAHVAELGATTEQAERLEAMIPGTNVYEAYTQRTLPGGLIDFDYFDAAREMRHNVMMVGPTGAGKTTAGRAYASLLQWPFASIEFSGGMDVLSTFGGPVVDPQTGLPVWHDGEITLGVRFPSIEFLDEVNFAPPRFTAGYHGVLDSRQTLYLPDKGERVPKHPDTLIFGAYNPRYTGTNLLNEAFTNRWAFTIDPWGYDDQVEAERVGEYTPTLLKRVREMRADPDIGGDIGTNAMEEFIHVAHQLNLEAASFLFLAKLEPEDRAIAERVLEAEKYNIAAELDCEIGPDVDRFVGDEDEEDDE